jgi:hypothetical protein
MRALRRAALGVDQVPAIDRMGRLEATPTLARRLNVQRITPV